MNSSSFIFFLSKDSFGLDTGAEAAPPRRQRATELGETELITVCVERTAQESEMQITCQVLKIRSTDSRCAQNQLDGACVRFTRTRDVIIQRPSNPLSGRTSAPLP